MDKQLERKVVHKFATLEDLAKQYNVPMGALQATIADYNKHQAEGTPDEMGRKIYKGAQAIGTGPWYCSILSPKVHHCMGGLETNSKSTYPATNPSPAFMLRANRQEAFTVP